MPRAYYEPDAPVIALRLAHVRAASREEAAAARVAGAGWLPLAADPYARIRAGRKRVEIRRDLPRYHHLNPGTTINLRCGYSGEDLLALITHRHHAPRLTDLPADVLHDADL